MKRVAILKTTLISCSTSKKFLDLEPADHILEEKKAQIEGENGCWG
jgi:hypothetical protein